MALTDQETQQIDEMIAAYRRTIKHIRKQILELERQKIVAPKFNVKISKKKAKEKK